MKKIYTIILVATLGFFFSGCDHYLDVNKNVDAPDEQMVMDYHYLAGIEAALQGVYWDIRATGPLSQMMGSSSYSNYAANYYSKASDAAGEMWRVTYWLQGKNLENLLEYAIKNERWTMAGIGYALKAHSWDITTKECGEMPCQQAYEPGRLSHDYDYQPLIYDSVRAWALRAIDYLEMDDPTVYGNEAKNADIIFALDKAKWIKFAHGIICRNLASLTRKSNFVSDYASDLIAHGKLAMQKNDDNVIITTLGGAETAQFSAYNNFWGTYRGNLTNGYWQSDFIVKIMTGTIPLYDDSGDYVRTTKDDHRIAYYPYELNPNQIIADTMVELAGHFDPRVAAKLATNDDLTYEDIDDIDSIKMRHYYGSSFTGAAGYIGTAANLYGQTGSIDKAVVGEGRWLFRNDAPYILMTAGEIQFEMAEAYWWMNDKANALACWKKGIELDMEFTKKYLKPGAKLAGKDKDGNDIFVKGGSLPGGDKITEKAFQTLATEYLNGPYVAGITTGTLTLSHIMMQKFVHMWPWGAYEAWVDLRKYHYDIDYSGDYPKLGNGWEKDRLSQKRDDDASKVYKGLYMAPAQFQGRRGSYNVDNQGSPCYRLRPRYNSEYMWNKPSLEVLKPIAGTADNYQCSIPWFAYPGDMPESI
ncbi:MAG: SusD/RagB family nutrient-binding outer membrane lipoprotein [Bacteroidales bacterium]|nr:SusD/RagB family nutrient-binding outer membrane lipoprotein [Bacteroidales bacterium]